MFERFLLRLTQTPVWKDRMVVKGANALVALTGDMTRTTTDLDMCSIDPLTADEAMEMFKAVAAASTPDVDPIVFEVENARVNTINGDADEPGHQIICVARIGTAEIKFKLEVTNSAGGVPQPIAMDFPTVFEGTAVPRVFAYSPSVIVAEKFHAMVRHGDRCTRMKDFYDVACLMKTAVMTGEDLALAFRGTFKNCATDLPDMTTKLPVFGDDYAPKGEKLWRAWADEKFGRSPNYKKQSFKDLGAVLEPFLSACVAMARGDQTPQDWKGWSWREPELTVAFSM